MGFGRRLVRKSVRRATPRSVRKVMSPVRTVRSAVTPRPIKSLSRAVYTVTNPLGAAENALIGAALGAGGHRHAGRASRTNRGQTNTAIAGIPAGWTARDLRAAEGLIAHDQFELLMAVQRQRFDPARPPVVPQPARLDSRALNSHGWSLRKNDARIWERKKRAWIKAQIAAETHDYVEAQFEWALQQADTDQAQATANWVKLENGQPDVLKEALTTAFVDNIASVTILHADGEDATLVLSLPGVDILPSRKAHLTPTGLLSVKTWTKTEFNDVYARVLGAHLLATTREAWAIGPSLQRLRIIGIAGRPRIDPEILFDVLVRRDGEDWREDDLGPVILGRAPFGLRRGGRTREVASWPPDQVSGDVKAWLGGI
jgi:hypothetical protein